MAALREEIASLQDELSKTSDQVNVSPMKMFPSLMCLVLFNPRFSH